MENGNLLAVNMPDARASQNFASPDATPRDEYKSEQAFAGRERRELQLKTSGWHGSKHRPDIGPEDHGLVSSETVTPEVESKGRQRVPCRPSRYELSQL
jgi:hypothetical protein